ncbi:MAG: hypothetical protein R3Y58_09090 [Eubacteriales bacterium]
MNHSNIAPSYTYLDKKTVIHGDGNKILPYNSDIYIGGKYSFQCTDSLYVKNVLISSAHIKVPYLAEGIELKELTINAIEKNIIPNVSRNNISDFQLEALSYAIGKAIHLWLYNEINLPTEEKNLMQEFIKKCYPNKNEYVE